MEVAIELAFPNARWTGAAPCRDAAVLRCDSRTGRTTLRDGHGELASWSDPLEALAWLDRDRKPAGGTVRRRWVGFLSYDLGRQFEQLPSFVVDDLHLPLFEFVRLPDEGVADSGAGESNPRTITGGSDLTSTFTRPAYLAAAERAIDYVRAGDVFQVNLSQRFSLRLPASPAEIYRRLQRSAPAQYGALLDFGGYALICNSPELFLRVTTDPQTGQRRVITRPIKGTRPRGPGMEFELRDSPKDAAELNMIVDLERNDLGRVCRTGSVRVTQPRTIEAHPTVYHGVATIEGILREEVTLVDLLRATFPGGSITGAPKIRAMQIIDELEPVRRGPYCGAIGYLDSDGTIEFNVAIRTMIVKGDRIHIPVGGGIVADSGPEAEYEETLVKARAMFDALGLP